MTSVLTFYSYDLGFSPPEDFIFLYNLEKINAQVIVHLKKVTLRVKVLVNWRL